METQEISPKEVAPQQLTKEQFVEGVLQHLENYFPEIDDKIELVQQLRIKLRLEVNVWTQRKVERLQQESSQKINLI